MTDGPAKPGEPESIAEVLASIRALVSAETEARLTGSSATDGVLMLTGDMRVSRPELLRDEPEATDAPILDEELLRRMINTIVREELKGELGEQINRTVRKLIRREVLQILEERDRQA